MKFYRMFGNKQFGTISLLEAPFYDNIGGLYIFDRFSPPVQPGAFWVKRGASLAAGAKNPECWRIRDF